jgi:hypothetical protein
MGFLYPIIKRSRENSNEICMDRRKRSDFTALCRLLDEALNVTRAARRIGHSLLFPQCRRSHP